jgi:hypothetical protein
MPFFTAPTETIGGNFGKNEFLRSTDGIKYESCTLAAASVPTETIDGDATQRVLQTGEVLAKITSGADIGKVGPFQLGVTDGRQTVANIVGLNATYAPWELHDGNDIEVAAVYIATAVQAWCFIRDTAANGGVRIALTDTVADAMRSVKGMDVTFK